MSFENGSVEKKTLKTIVIENACQFTQWLHKNEFENHILIAEISGRKRNGKKMIYSEISKANVFE